jgi:hypothetical protein
VAKCFKQWCIKEPIEQDPFCNTHEQQQKQQQLSNKQLNENNQYLEIKK